MEKEQLCRLALVVSSDDWSTATWLVPGLRGWWLARRPLVACMSTVPSMAGS